MHARNPALNGHVVGCICGALDGTDQKLCACLASTLFPGREGFAESLSTQLLIPQMLVADSGALP